MRSLLLPLLLGLSACEATGPLARTPDKGLMDEIEAKLRAVPCVGPMNHWERHYTYSSKPSLLASLITFGTSNRWFHYQSIDITYYQAGFEEFRAGRVLSDDSRFDADDRSYNLVYGHYDIPTNTAYLWACGPNLGGTPKLNIVVR